VLYNFFEQYFCAKICTNIEFAICSRTSYRSEFKEKDSRGGRERVRRRYTLSFYFIRPFYRDNNPGRDFFNLNEKMNGWVVMT
jgi:hypothetical protein